MYYQQREAYSSRAGVVITIISVSVFVIYAIWLFISVFQKSEWNLELKSDTLSYTLVDWKTNAVIKDDYCNEENCIKLSLEKFITAYFDTDPYYCISFKEADWPSIASQEC